MLSWRQHAIHLSFSHSKRPSNHVQYLLRASDCFPPLKGNYIYPLSTLDLSQANSTASGPAEKNTTSILAKPEGKGRLS